MSGLEAGFLVDAIDIDRLSPWEDEPYQRLDAPLPSRFAVTDLDDVEFGEDPISLIDGLLTSTGLAVVFGVPKSGKSFVISDALFHVAMGRPWAGREVLQGAVAYVTAEGVNGFKRRLIAMRRHYGVEGKGVPFGMIPVAPDLGHASGDDALLIEAIRAWLASKGNPPLRAIAIDTLARAMKGADENAAKDIALLVDNCERIAAAFGCLVIVVHHAGKDMTRGSRGSNALDGAADVMWSVDKGEGVSTVSIHAMKDGEEGINWQFRLVPFAFDDAPQNEGRNMSATSTRTVEIVTPPESAQRERPDRNKKLADSPRLLLGIVTDAMIDAGEFVRDRTNVPHEERALSREMLKKYLRIKGYWDDERPDNANRATLSRDLKTLKVRQFIGLTDEYLWMVRA